MPVSGLIITLQGKPGTAGAATAIRRVLADIEGLEFGRGIGVRFPAVLEADDYASHDRRLEALRDHDDICFVDLVSHEFSDIDTFGDRPRRRNRRRRV